MYRVKLIRHDGTYDVKRFRGALEAGKAAEASVKTGKARQAFVYVDTPEGLRLKQICTARREVV